VQITKLQQVYIQTKEIPISHKHKYLNKAHNIPGVFAKKWITDWKTEANGI